MIIKTCLNMISSKISKDEFRNMDLGHQKCNQKSKILENIILVFICTKFGKIIFSSASFQSVGI